VRKNGEGRGREGREKKIEVKKTAIIEYVIILQFVQFRVTSAPLYN